MSDDMSARPRVRGVRVESKTDNVADVTAGAVFGIFSVVFSAGDSGKGVSAFEGYVNDGNDDSIDGICSHL